MQHDSGEFLALLGSAFSTFPPLVHFTTADLSAMADGKYDVGKLAAKLNALNATVIITREHVVEMLPLFADSRERRLRLLDALPRVSFLEWSAELAWTPKNRGVNIQVFKAKDIRESFLTPAGIPRDWIQDVRNTERRLGDAEFFQRRALLARGIGTGQRSADKYRMLQSRRVDKFQRENEKHGSNILRLAALSNRWASWSERAQKRLGHLIPKWLSNPVVSTAKEVGRRVESLRPWLEAAFMGVSPDNHGFLLWWEAKQKLWAKDMEVGGLGERIDLHELRWWPICALITLDKRVLNAVTEAFRALNDDRLASVSERFLRAGDENAIHARLDHLSTLLRTAVKGETQDGA